MKTLQSLQITQLHVDSIEENNCTEEEKREFCRKFAKLVQHVDMILNDNSVVMVHCK